MGRVLVSITEDTCGWHDTLCGVSTAEMATAKYGEARYQEHRNAFHRNGRELFLIELGKWGLGKRDLVANLNFFSKVTVDEAGDMTFLPGHSRPGSYVDLRAEMNTLVVLNTCPHPLDPSPKWDPRPIDLVIWNSDPVTEDDLCRNWRPENRRGFANTETYFCQAPR
jgi:urea carboxylase-associated protein 2